MIMVFKAKTLLYRVQWVSPRLYSFFTKIHEAIGSSRETEVVEKAYRLMYAINFSRA